MDSFLEGLGSERHQIWLEHVVGGTKGGTLFGFHTFMEAFNATFGDIKERMAKTKIQNLQQGSRLAAIYTAEC